MNLFRYDRMIARRKQVGLTQQELAKRVGCSQQAITKWESGASQRPRLLKELSESLSCSEDWLLGGEDAPSTPRAVGVISWVQAGALAEAVDALQLNEVEDWIEYPLAARDKMIGLNVRGTSMNRISPDGSKIIVDLNQRDMTSNRLYIVKVGHDNEVTYKRFKSNPDRLEPFSTDDSHDIIFLEGQKVQVVGRVIHTQLSLL